MVIAFINKTEWTYSRASYLNNYNTNMKRMS